MRGERERVPALPAGAWRSPRRDPALCPPGPGSPRPPREQRQRRAGLAADGGWADRRTDGRTDGQRSPGPVAAPAAPPRAPPGSPGRSPGAAPGPAGSPSVPFPKRRAALACGFGCCFKSPVESGVKFYFRSFFFFFSLGSLFVCEVLRMLHALLFEGLNKTAWPSLTV